MIIIPAVTSESLGEPSHQPLYLIILCALLQHLDATAGIRHEAGPGPEGVHGQRGQPDLLFHGGGGFYSSSRSSSQDIVVAVVVVMVVVAVVVVVVVVVLEVVILVVVVAVVVVRIYY